MKNIKNLSFLGLAIAIFLSSCSMEKRIYTSGYHIDWHKSKQNTHQCAAIDKTEKVAQNEIKQETKQEINQDIPVNAEPIVQVQTSENVITASNDHNPIILSAAATAAANQIETAAKAEVKVAKVHYSPKVAKTNAPKGGNKSWLVAFLLCFFLGTLGIHRFYLGYTWQGVVQLLTFGGFGIWALIDLFRIIFKSLKPKDGDYD
jgi:hypothetical protein